MDRIGICSQTPYSNIQMSTSLSSINTSRENLKLDISSSCCWKRLVDCEFKGPARRSRKLVSCSFLRVRGQGQEEAVKREPGSELLPFLRILVCWSAIFFKE